MAEITLVLEGRIKPYVRMTRRSKWVNAEAQAYLASKMAIGLQANGKMAARGLAILPGRTPLAVTISIEHAGGYHNRDLDNEVKAILDGLQGVVFPDDRWIDCIFATRAPGDLNRVAVTVSTYVEEVCVRWAA